jgi:signal transduction histidine kinase
MNLSEQSAKRLTLSAESPPASFQDVDVRRELSVRVPRGRNHEHERDALVVLAREMSANPRNMLQKLVELAVDLCSAPTAGISLLDGVAVRWEAMAGVLASQRGKMLARDRSPCGVCIDQNATQLMRLPDRSFPALALEPRFVELLMIPFHARGRPIGTVWVVSHSADRTFDREDERILLVFAEFAAAGWQLWKAFDAAADASGRKDAFLATLGHELRNPLAAITTATSIISHEIVGNARAQRAVDVVARQCRHVARLADDLLDAGRIASGKLQLETKLVNLAQLLAEAVDTCRGRVEERGIDLSVELPDASIWIDGDVVRLTQTFCNLIDNAAKYTPTGGRVFVSSDLDNYSVRIAVGDTGRGIRSDQLQLIFEPFAQLSESQTARAGGLGLGLSLVRSIVELHGGFVTAQSDGPGKGSRFTVNLPLRRMS